MRSSRSANLERMSKPLCLNNRGQCKSELVQVSISLRLTSIFRFPVGLAARTDFLSPRQAELEKAC